jgi:hypothetical protein
MFYDKNVPTGDEGKPYSNCGKNIPVGNGKRYFNDSEMRRKYIRMVKEAIYEHESKLVDLQCGVELAKISLDKWKKYLETIEVGMED